MRRLLLTTAVAALAGCAGNEPLSLNGAQPVHQLAAAFDCLRQNKLALISAHRGGPAPGFPENAIETFKRTYESAPVLIELDVRRTSDGELILLHDATLDRTTTGTGNVAAITQEALAALKLKDPTGAVTPYRVPTFKAVLAWAKKAEALLQVEVKDPMAVPAVIAAIREAGLVERIVMIVNRPEDALAILQLEPQLMVSVDISDAAVLEALAEEGMPLMHLLAFTGTRAPMADFNAALAAYGVEAIFGTLGRPGTRLDDSFLADGNGSEYARLVTDGVQLIATDRPLEAYRALQEANVDGNRCLRRGLA